MKTKTIFTDNKDGLELEDRLVLRKLPQDRYRLWLNARLKWVNLYGFSVMGFEELGWCCEARKIIGD